MAIRKWVYRGVCLLLAVACAGGWVCSYWYFAGVYWLGNNSHTIHSSDGKVYVQQTEWAPAAPRFGGVLDDSRGIPPRCFTSAQPDHGTRTWLGFSYGDYEFETYVDAENRATKLAWHVGIPWWFITSIPAGLCLLTWKRRRAETPPAGSQPAP